MLAPLSTDPVQWQAYIASAFTTADMSRRADEAVRAGVDFAALQRAAVASLSRESTDAPF